MATGAGVFVVPGEESSRTRQLAVNPPAHNHRNNQTLNCEISEVESDTCPTVVVDVTRFKCTICVCFRPPEGTFSRRNKRRKATVNSHTKNINCRITRRSTRSISQRKIPSCSSQMISCKSVENFLSRGSLTNLACYWMDLPYV